MENLPMNEPTPNLEVESMMTYKKGKFEIIVGPKEAILYLPNPQPHQVLYIFTHLEPKCHLKPSSLTPARIVALLAHV